MKPTPDDSAVALSTQQRSRKSPKGDRSNKDPAALCHLPSHSLSMHRNAECRTQNPSLPPLRSNQNPRPMGRTTTPAASPSSRGLAAISSLSDSEKARLFNHLQNAQANAVSQNNVSSTDNSSTSDSTKDNTVYFANVYSAMARSSNKSDDMVSDLGAD